MDLYSDSESVYSLDSLEDKTNDNYKISVSDNITKKNVVKCNNISVPYYKGEISVEYIPNEIEYKPRNSIVSPLSAKNREVKSSRTLKEKFNRSTIDQTTSYLWNYFPSKPQVCRQRMSRRKELVTQSQNSLRERHRSVSYLEQFRKKTSGKNNMDTSIFSRAHSEFCDRDRSLSFVSCLSGESRSISEFDFCDEITMSPTINEQLNWDKRSLQSSTLLTEKNVECEKPIKSTTQNKVKPIILSKVELIIPNQQKTELDKKKSIEKSKVYANKVKLRNQIKINCQKEKDKKDKFQGPSVLLDHTTEDCFLQPEKNHFCCTVSDRKPKVFPIPNTSFQGRTTANYRKIFTNEEAQKSKRKETQQRFINKHNNILELSSLQERHEREKSLIDSMRNLILKT